MSVSIPLVRKEKRFTITPTDTGDVVEKSRIPTTKERNFVEHRIGVPIHKFADDKSYLEAGSSKVWAAFRSCHLVASVIQSTEYYLGRVDGSSREVKNPIALGYLTKPNPLDTWSEVLYQWTFHMMLTGKAYWLKDQIDGNGIPRAIYPLIPQYVKIIPHATDGISRFEYHVNGTIIKYDRDEIIYFRRPHPMSPILGMGDIEPSEGLYNSHINRNLYEEKFIEQGAAPSGVLTLKQEDVDEDYWGKLKKMWKKEYEGKKNIGKTALLTGDWTYQQLGLSQRDMESVEKDRTNVHQIFINHGIPLSVAGIEKATALATARQDEINFRAYTVLPYVRMLARKLNGEGVLFDNFAEGIKLKYELSGLVNVEQVIKDFGPVLDRGALTPNELREMCDLPVIDNPFLDQFFVRSGVVPIEMAGLAKIEETDEGLGDIIKHTSSK